MVRADLAAPPSAFCRRDFRSVARLSDWRMRTPFHGAVLRFVQAGKVREVWPGAETRSCEVRAIRAAPLEYPR